MGMVVASRLLVQPNQKMLEREQGQKMANLKWWAGLWHCNLMGLMLLGIFESREAWLNSTIPNSAAEGPGPKGNIPALQGNHSGLQVWLGSGWPGD